MSEWTIGIIGGSGLYAIDALEDAQWIAVDTPWGAPSDDLLIGRIAGVKFVFLPRHGRGHRIPPSQLNVRANIDALKRAGCTDLLAISAVGSLSEDLRRAASSSSTSSSTGPSRANRASSAPASSPMSRWPTPSARASPRSPPMPPRRRARRSRASGCYVAIEGPQFSTRAESRAYRAWGGDVIGMTGMPEAKLAREAELPYASVGMVTDYDCWREDCEAVDVAQILARLDANAATARRLVVALATRLPKTRAPSPIDTNLDPRSSPPPRRAIRPCSRSWTRFYAARPLSGGSNGRRGSSGWRSASRPP